MSALSGSLTYQRFFVDRPLPRDFVARSHDKIVALAMRALSPNEPEDERSGWCVMGEPLDVELDRSRVFLDGFVNLGVRIDRWAIPSAVLKTRLREVEQKERERRGRDRLGRNERSEIKELVTRELRKKVLPVVRVSDLSWSLEEGVLRFFSHSKKSTATMLALFEKTFGFEPTAESPYTQSRRLTLSDAQLRAWDSIEPLSLAARGGAA